MGVFFAPPVAGCLSQDSRPSPRRPRCSPMAKGCMVLVIVTIFFVVYPHVHKVLSFGYSSPVQALVWWRWQPQPSTWATRWPPLTLSAPPDASVRALKLWSYRASSCHDGDVEPIETGELVLVVVARGSAPYVEEWVLYHLFLGVDLIYLYDNEDKPTYQALFRCNPRVNVIPFPPQQGAPYDSGIMANLHFFANFNARHVWAAILSLDEFIVLPRHGDIKEMAQEVLPPRLSASSPSSSAAAASQGGGSSSSAIPSRGDAADAPRAGTSTLFDSVDFRRASGLAMQWLVFGHNDAVTAVDAPVSQRFTRHNARLDRLVRTMFLCGDTINQTHPHYVVRLSTCRDSGVAWCGECDPACFGRLVDATCGGSWC